MRAASKSADKLSERFAGEQLKAATARRSAVEADLAAARAKLTEKSDKERSSLVEKRDKLVAKRDALNTEINEANQRLEELGTGGDVPDADPIEATTIAAVEDVKS